MEHVRITETFSAKDTLTVTTALVQDPNKFFDMIVNIVGANFLKVPFE